MVTSAKADRLFVSTACLPGVDPLIDRISSYLLHGMDGIELGGGVSADKNILAGIPRNEIRFLVHNYFPPPHEPFVLNLASSDPSIRRKSIELVKRAIEISAELGAPFYSVHAGFVTDPYAYGETHYLFHPPSAVDAGRRASDNFLSALSQADQYARSHGVGLLIENNVCPPELSGKLLLQTPEEFLDFFRVFDNSNVGILLDFGHLNVTARTFGFDRIEFIDRLIPHIRALHLHDNDGKDDTHKPVLETSWVLDVLRRYDFALLPLIIEAHFHSVDDLKTHVDRLMTWLNR